LSLSSRGFSPSFCQQLLLYKPAGTDVVRWLLATTTRIECSWGRGDELDGREEAVSDGAQDLSQNIQEQVLKSGQDFYANSLGSLKGQLENDSSQLQQMLEQLPDSQEDARAQLEALVASYEALANSLDEFAHEHSVEDAVNQVFQQAQEETGEEVGGGTEAVGEATKQAQGTVGEAAPGDQDAAEDAAGPAQEAEDEPEQAQEATEEVGGQEQDAEEGETTEERRGVLGRAAGGVGKAVGKVGRTARRLVPGMHLLSEDTDEEAGQTVQRTVDESGDIIETTLDDESGEPIDEQIVGTVKDLPTEEEYTNEEGQTVRTVKEQRGALIHIKLGPDGSLLDQRLPPQKEEVKEREVLEEGGRSESSSETS